jgi:hypothetical protein
MENLQPQEPAPRKRGRPRKNEASEVAPIKQRRMKKGNYAEAVPLAAPVEEERELDDAGVDARQYDRQIRKFILSKFADRELIETSEVLKGLPSDARKEWAKALHEACLLRTIQAGGSLDAITRAVKVVVDNLTEQKESEGAAYEEALKLVEMREKGGDSLLGPIDA